MKEIPKKQQQIAAAILLVILLIICIFAFIYTPKKQPAVLIADQASLEFGQDIEEMQDQVIEGDLLDTIAYDTSNVVMDPVLDVPAVGSYSVEVFDGTSSLGTVTVYVNDTVKPDFDKAPETIQVDEGYSGDILSYFEAADLSGVSLRADLSKVDFYTPGAYDGTVTASDAHGNERTAPFTVQVIEGSGLISVVPETGTIKDDILIVNKKNPLPEDYDPKEDPEALAAISVLIMGMKNAGLDVSETYSGYRTYNSQKQLYENAVLEHGQQAADLLHARPGYSEHQTGLAFDLKHEDGSLLEKEAEVKWLEANAASYGFILRYPQGKEEITGYQYEPWHLRYIGDRAGEIQSSGLTLEEFLDVEGGDYS